MPNSQGGWTACYGYWTTNSRPEIFGLNLEAFEKSCFVADLLMTISDSSIHGAIICKAEIADLEIMTAFRAIADEASMEDSLWYRAIPPHISRGQMESDPLYITQGRLETRDSRMVEEDSTETKCPVVRGELLW